MKFTDFITSKKEIKIGFLGGSITFGTGASFSDINAAIGGTCPDFGLFRMEKQLLSENPDMGVTL